MNEKVRACEASNGKSSFFIVEVLFFCDCSLVPFFKGFRFRQRQARDAVALRIVHASFWQTDIVNPAVLRAFSGDGQSDHI